MINCPSFTRGDRVTLQDFRGNPKQKDLDAYQLKVGDSGTILAVSAISKDDVLVEFKNAIVHGETGTAKIWLPKALVELAPQQDVHDDE